MEALPAEPPMPNLGSPRVQAAMKVLGVQPRDLEKQDAEAFDGLESRQLLFEKKRRALIFQVSSLATRGPQGGTSIQKGEYPVPPEKDTSFMDEVLRKEKAAFEVMQRMAKKDIQKTVVQELECKLELHKGKKRQEEGLARVKQLKKQRDEVLATLAKEAQKRTERSKEARDKADRALLAHCEELKETLAKADERVTKCLSDIKESYKAGIEANEAKRTQTAARQAAFEASKVRRREVMHDEIEEKHKRKQEMLESMAGQRASNKEATAEREQQCRDKVAARQQKKQADIEEKYWEIQGRHQQAKEFRETTHAARLKEFKTNNQKKVSAHQSRYDRILAELEKPRESRSLQRSASETLRPRERPELLKAREDAENHVHLAAANRQRLREAHHHAVEQQIDKLLMMREKVQVMEDTKAQADRRRMAVLRNTSIEKHDLQLKVDRFKDVGPEKMLNMLENQELDSDARKRINEILGELELPPLGGHAQAEDQ